MAYTFDVVETQAQPALAIRTVTSVESLPQEIGKAYGAVLSFIDIFVAKILEQVLDDSPHRGEIIDDQNLYGFLYHEILSTKK